MTAHNLYVSYYILFAYKGKFYAHVFSFSMRSSCESCFK